MLTNRAGLMEKCKRHVTALLAVVICNLAFTSAHTDSQAVLIKLLSEKQKQDSSQIDNSHYNDLDPAFSSAHALDVKPLWLSPELSSREGSAEEDLNELVESGESETEEEAVKRFHPQAFFGARGKRTQSKMSETLFKRFQGFFGSRGKRMSGMDELLAEAGSSSPAFIGGRGKRIYLPGLETLLLTRMYHNLNADKGKRQSHMGFHAARG